MNVSECNRTHQTWTVTRPGHITQFQPIMCVHFNGMSAWVYKCLDWFEAVCVRDGHAGSMTVRIDEPLAENFDWFFREWGPYEETK